MGVGRKEEMLVQVPKESFSQRGGMSSGDVITQHGGSSSQLHIVYFKIAKEGDCKCSHHKGTLNIVSDHMLISRM